MSNPNNKTTQKTSSTSSTANKTPEQLNMSFSQTNSWTNGKTTTDRMTLSNNCCCAYNFIESNRCIFHYNFYGLTHWPLAFFFLYIYICVYVRDIDFYIAHCSFIDTITADTIDIYP